MRVSEKPEPDEGGGLFWCAYRLGRQHATTFAFRYL